MSGAEHPSGSQAQRDAERVIFARVQQLLNVSLESNPTISLPGADCRVRPDFYSHEPPVAGEIFAHLGALRVGQAHKLAGDILKLLLLERASGRTYRKIVAVCDPEVERYLRGNSWLAGSVRQFGIEIIRVEPGAEILLRLRAAQRKQNMVNPNTQ